jgi:hypothetical protein
VLDVGPPNIKRNRVTCHGLEIASRIVGKQIIWIVQRSAQHYRYFWIAQPFHVTPPVRLAFIYVVGGSMAQAVAMVIAIAYSAGILAWILLFAAHRTGIQRLSNLQTIVKR